MLEVKDLVKSYSAKGGVTVKALDGVSVKFPEKGMVFLLGKSGSGKSTLLNVAGGLDRPDSGEVIVKGRSSKDFSPSDFDSYRNTFVGFVFQEYNILNEFTVEQNIALALQLQNKRNDKHAVEDLLEKVDLKGLGKRKPNTLSGGQKQRVAIARALIKEPEIIMADEPTGALDSTTGKQVLETLKKLSETKLVIVVSHDREFAELYGDRIIELKDGKIISDVSKAFAEPAELSENVRIISDDTISITNAANITDADVKNIVALLKKNGGEAVISANKSELAGVKRACKINDSGTKEYFKDTESVDVKEYNGKETAFIKSRLPASRAIKMGASGLKTKPIRLIFTILLAVVAFIMFGVVSTFMLYDPDYSVSQALKEAGYPSMTLNKYYTYINRTIRVDTDGTESVDYESESTYMTRFGVQELKDKNAAGGMNFAGIFNFSDDRWENNRSISILIAEGNSFVPVSVSGDYYPVKQAAGFSDCGKKYMEDNGFTLLGGKYPQNKTEVALPEYLANLMALTPESGITEARNAVGKKIKFSGCDAINGDQTFTVSGVYEVGKIPEKYNPLKEDSSSLSPNQKDALSQSLTDYLSKSFNTVIYVTEDFYEEYAGNIYHSSGNGINSENYPGFIIEDYEMDYTIDEYSSSSVYTQKSMEKYPEAFKFFGIDGQEQIYGLSEDEVYVTQQLLTAMMAEQYREIYGRYVEPLRGLRSFDPVANTELDDSSEFMEAYYNMYGDPQNALTVKNGISKWYKVLKEREFLYSTGNDLNNMLQSDYGGLGSNEKYADFKAKYEKISEYYNPDKEVTSQDWENFKTALNALTNDEKAERIFYVRYAQEMLNVGDYEELEPLGLDELIGRILSEPANSDEAAAELKRVVDSNYLRITGFALGDVARFEPDLQTKDPVVYYKDYLGNSGTLKIAGVFTCGQDNYCQYFVSSSFVEKHAAEVERTVEYYSTEVSDYTPPEDAKYNYLISLTDNSQEQISVALQSEGDVVYGLTNNIYQQLQFFLDMIKEMQTIFLIVGAVVGVFAALMLLNFISVSISAKRKDIGILRAVGARGSDVFKIFFAEALIIALICFVIATVGAFVVCNILNASLVEIISMKLLNFNVINVLLILGISLGISLIATFFPVFIASKKSPVDSIRAL